MQRQGLWAILVSAGACLNAAAATPPTGYPPPGNYKIDTDAVTSTGAGRTSVEMRVQTDGATGAMTSTSRASDGAVASQTIKGSKPITWCVSADTAATVRRNTPFMCQTTNVQASGTGSSFSAACQSSTMESSFQRIDPRTWEHTMTFQVRADATPSRSARGAYAMALPHMSAAEREEAEKALDELPSQTQMDAMRADMLRDAEEAVRTAETPEEASAARQVLEALRRTQDGTAVQRTVRVKERWTLLGIPCSPAP